MAGEATTIARPYAEAVFARAKETGKLDAWSDMLSFLTDVVEDSTMAVAIADPLFERENLAQLMLEIGEDGLDDEGKNLVRLLVQNDRLPVVPELAGMYEVLKAESQQVLNVHIRSAFALQPAQEKHIADALKAKLGREITIFSEKDPDLIGGVLIRAGDTVIDGSVSGQLQQLANELGI